MMKMNIIMLRVNSKEVISGRGQETLFQNALKLYESFKYLIHILKVVLVSYYIILIGMKSSLQHI